MKKLLLTLAIAAFVATGATAAPILCGVNTSGQTTTSGTPIMDVIQNCTTAQTPFTYFGSPPPSGVENTNLCPINQAACDVIRYKCTAAPLTSYDTLAQCNSNCNEVATCQGSTITLAESGSGSADSALCVDSNLYIRVIKGSDTLYYLQYLDTSPAGAVHANCEPQGQYFIDPVSLTNWHTIRQVDLSYMLGGSHTGSPDSLGLSVKFCLKVGWPRHASGTDTDWYSDLEDSCVTDAMGSAGRTVDPAAGAHSLSYIYYYEVSVSGTNNNCPLSSMFSSTADKCVFNQPVTGCPADAPFDPLTGMCTSAPVCPDFASLADGRPWTMAYNPASHSCEGSPVCPADLTAADGHLFAWNRPCVWTNTARTGGTNSGCTGDCPTTCDLVATLPAGAAYIGTTGWVNAVWDYYSLPTGNSECRATPDVWTSGGNSGVTCPPGAYKVGSYCVASVICPFGTYNPATGICQGAPDCPYGSVYQCLGTSPKTCEKKADCVPEPYCPSGYQCSCTNGTPPTCGSISGVAGTFDGGADACYVPGAALCPAGMTWDAGVKGCVQAPDCGGGTFDPTSHKCTAPASTSCPDAGYIVNALSSKCENTLSCPSNTLWIAASDRCETALAICPAGYSWDSSLGACNTLSTCAAGTTLNITRDQCERTPSCLSGTAYSASLNKCTAGTTCPSGTVLNGTTDKCEVAPPCNAGFTYSTTNNRCEKTATATTTYSCPSGGTLSGTTCTISGSYAATATTTYSCPSGGTLSGTTCTISGSYAATASNYDCEISGGSCSRPYSAFFYPACGGWPNTTPPAGGTWMGQRCSGGTREIWYRVTTYSCPSGGSLSGTTCYTSSTYAATGTTTYSCPSGGSLSGTTCYTSSTYAATATTTYSCPSGGSLSGTTCWQSVTCVAGTTLNTTSDKCDATASCLAGTAYDSTNNLCAVSSTCPGGGTLNTTYDVCQSSPVCPASYAYAPTRDRCESTGAPTWCPAATVYDVPTGKCTASLTCPGTGTRASGSLLCQEDPNTACTIAGYSPISMTECDRVANCSAADSTLNLTVNLCTIPGVNLCPAGWGFSTATSGPTLDACTQNPLCAGLSYDSTANLCCNCASPNGCMTSVVSNPNPLTDYRCSPSKCFDVAGVTATPPVATYVQADTPWSSTGTCPVDRFFFSGKPVFCHPYGTQFWKDCCSDQAGCPVSDIQTQIDMGAKLTVFVGTDCSFMDPFNTGCAQTYRTYCKFDSLLARIVQEQARGQIKRITTTYPSGALYNTAALPDCTGFKPEELKLLDWSKIDLTEYIQSLTAGINQTVADAQTGLTTAVTNFQSQLTAK